MANLSDDYEDDTMTGQPLIAYRLGRVEKAVDNINQQSIDRDDKIMTELHNITSLSGQVALNTESIKSLKESRSNMYKFISAMALSLFAVIMQIAFKVI